MGMIDAAIKSTMEDLKKPRPRAPRSFSSPKSFLSPWAWKASILFWRRLAKKNPPKPHVIKPSISTLSSSPSAAANWAPCKRAKPVPIPTKSYTNYTSNNFFYYSYPNHTPNDDVKFVPNSMYGYSVVRTKVRSRGSVAPTTCDYSPNLINMEYQNTLPYFQLHHSGQHGPLRGSTGRLPLYIVS